VPFGSWLSGLIFIYILVLAGSMLVSLAVPYVVLRMRESRSASPDPQIGVKAALYFFFSFGIVLFLTGLTTFVMDLLVDKRPPAVAQGLNDVQRASLGVMVSGFFFAVLHLGLVKAMTNDRNPTARRTFAGWRLAIHGMVVILAVTTILGILFQKDFGGAGLEDLRKQVLGVMMVWIPSWIIHLVLLGRHSRPLYEPSRLHDGD
jgi:hypothetical protein